MKNFLKAFFVGVVFSLYYFPFEFSFLPGLNTKKLLAVIGLIVLVQTLIRKKTVEVPTSIIGVSLLSIVFSLVSYVSVVLNTTEDLTYATYCMSMAVWLSGAYAVIRLVGCIHGRSSLQLVFHYLAFVCAAQAVLGIIIDNVPFFQSLVDRYIVQDIVYLHKTNRLYGIGAYFDTAGIRFSCALVGISYLILQEGVSTYWKRIYIVLMALIIVLGSIMSRTTTVGVVLSLLFFVVSKFRVETDLHLSRLMSFGRVLSYFCIAAFASYFLYHHSPTFHEYLEYGFEGFFNYVETGEWTTSSTEKLSHMVVFPDNARTWLIGDGYFEDPYHEGSFYKGTDVGYLRIIFYCGTIGLVAFFSMLVYCIVFLMKRYPQEKFLFFLLIVIQLIVWMKISTDIFVILALLILLPDDAAMGDETIFNEI